VNTENSLYIRGYRYRIYPTEEQAKTLSNIFRDCRSVRNRLVGWMMEFGIQKGRHTTSVKLPALIKQAVTIIKTELSQSATSTRALVTVAETLYTQYKRADQRLAEYPNFKSPKGYMSAHYPPELYQLGVDTLEVGGVDGKIKIILHRPLPDGVVKKFILSKTPTGEHYVSFTLKLKRERSSGDREVGLDMGIIDFAIDSDGERYPNPKLLLKAQNRIEHLNKHLSRKVVNSKSWRRLKEKIQKFKRKVINRRKDFLHQLSARLVDSCRVIGVERLDIKKMLGDERYRFSISDAGWGEFKRQLTYKSIESYNTKLVFANQFFASTHICSCCKVKRKEKLPTSIRSWTCEYCGTHHDRDINAALNLKRVALEAVEKWKSRSNTRVIFL
jgi:putative transposase